MLRVFKKSTYAILSALMMLCAGCSQEKKLRIGVSQCSQDDWRAKMNEEINREAMFHDDVEVEIRSADDSNAKQIEDIRYFADNGFDIIIASPNEAEAVTPVIKEVYDRGIPVIIFDRNIIGDSYTARIGVDDTALGASAARYALHLCGSQPKAIEVYGLKGSTPAAGRHAGFAKAFEEGGGHLLSSVYGNWNKEEAMPLVDSLLDIYTDVDLIYAHNDRMGIGAAEVAKKRGLDDIRIIGIDAAPNIGIKAVADSVIDATFLYPTEGYRLVRTALAILKGQPYERDVVLPVSSAVDLTNADILLLQNESLDEETAKIRLLKSQVDDYWQKHSAQTMLFYACVVIIALLMGVLFLLLRAFWDRRRHQEALLEQNKLLEHERDVQKSLNAQLEEATQSKLAFFTNVSHDLRTPLALIAEPVNQLSGAPNLTPSQHTVMRIAEKNVHILKRLINQILDFRKYENGKLAANLHEADLTTLVTEWAEAFRETARRRDIKLVVNCQTPVKLAIDVEKIERVFFNLVSNALKHTRPNGSIEIGCHCSDAEAVISVRDSGTGISADDLAHIFERFFQADKVHPQGSGIGLSLAKAFVELHGGTITVESTLGKGSVFTVTLPVRHVAAESPANAQCNIDSAEIEAEIAPVQPRLPDSRDAGADADPSRDDNNEAEKPLVLVIDDNDDMQKLLDSILSAQYRVICASNGHDGLRMAARYVPDLVICDVMMPVMDGMECCRRIKEEVSTSHIPVLMLTACSMDEERARGYDSGADGYVSKPFSGRVVLARCQNLILNRKRIKDLWQNSDTPSTLVKDRADAPAQPSHSGAIADPDNDFYRRFLEVFTARMGNADLNIETLAAEMGLGHSQFYRKIKALTNYSPVELMRRLRLEKARTLLTTTAQTVSEIAYGVGFSTPAYFTKCYRAAYGETPTELRERLGFH